MTDDDLEGLTPSKGGSTIQDRIAAFEMLDKMGNSTQAQKTVRLSLVGFNRQDIAAMLQISPALVSQNLYAEKNKKKPAARKPQAKKAE